MKKIKLKDITLPRDLELSYKEPVKLDERDRKMLCLLSAHGRMTIAELAKEVGLSRDATKYRLDRLLHNRVIQGFTAVVNPPAIGLPLYCGIYVALWNINPQRERDLVAYVKATPNIIYAVKCVGKWDLGFEVFAKDLGHLDEILKELREKFADVIKDVEIVPYVKEYKWTEFPREV